MTKDHLWGARLASLLFLCGWPVSAFGGELVPAESRIVKVIVMADRAEVVRLVTASVPKGESIVVVESLRADLDERTLRANSAQGAAIQGISSDLVKRKVLPPTEKPALLKRLGEAQARTDAIDASVLGLRRQVDLARSYRSRTLDAIGLQAMFPVEKLPQGKLDLESWGRALEALSEQEGQTLDKTRDLEVERFALQQEMQEIQQQLKQHDEPRIEDVRRALVGVSSAQAAPITFQLVYRVSGPTWRLHYDLRYDSQKKLLTVDGYGMVLQETAEDWKDVELVLSTRLPVSGLRAPQAQPLVLEGQDTQAVQRELATYSEQISARDIALPPAKEAAAAPAAAGETPALPGKEVEQPKPIAAAEKSGWKARGGLEEFVALESSLTGQTFKVLKKTTVLNGSGPQQVSILRAEVPASEVYECVPKSSPTVYRRVMAKNTSGAPLLAGRAALFLDGGMVGVTAVPTVPPGNEMALSFGSVDGLSVASTAADAGEAAVAQTGVASQKGKRTYRFTNKYELYNQSEKPAQVRVLDTVPTSEVKEVEVAVDEKVSSKYDALGNGVLSFQVKAEAKKTASVELDYSITIPENLRF